MRLRIVTVASDLYGVGDQRLIMDSQVNNEAIVVLSADTPYFDELEQAMKIRKYVKQRNVSQMPEKHPADHPRPAMTRRGSWKVMPAA